MTRGCGGGGDGDGGGGGEGGGGGSKGKGGGGDDGCDGGGDGGALTGMLGGSGGKGKTPVPIGAPNVQDWRQSIAPKGCFHLQTHSADFTRPPQSGCRFLRVCSASQRATGRATKLPLPPPLQAPVSANEAQASQPWAGQLWPWVAEGPEPRGITHAG